MAYLSNDYFAGYLQGQILALTHISKTLVQIALERRPLDKPAFIAMAQGYSVSNDATLKTLGEHFNEEEYADGLRAGSQEVITHLINSV